MWMRAWSCSHLRSYCSTLLLPRRLTWCVHALQAVLSTLLLLNCGPPACLQSAQLPLKADGVEARVVHKQLLGFIQRSDPR